MSLGFGLNKITLSRQ